MVDPLDDDFGIDLSSYEKKQDQALEDTSIDLQSYSESKKGEPSWSETVGDWLTQAGRGALRVFTWPADILKLSIIGEGLSDIDDLENAFQKAGKPFDRETYIQSVFDQARYVPTQDLLEQEFEDLTGISLEPKTAGGKRIKQGTELALFARGGPLKRLTAAGAGVGTTEGLKQAGVQENKAELVGDIAGLSSSAIKKMGKEVPAAAKDFEQTAIKHALPFKEFMTRSRETALKGRLTKNAEQRLKEELRLSSEDALKKIVTDELPIKRLKERGINLDALGEQAYAQTRRLAQAKPNVIKTDDIVKNIDSEISRIKSLAPTPSDAQKKAIKILEEERDVLKVSKPNSEQLINQHINYNANTKSIYAKPEFRGEEEQVRKAYAFLNNQLVEAISKQGNADVANAFKAANKIYHETSKLSQTESLLNRAFKDGYSPKKLENLLHSKNGRYLERNLGKKALEEIREIATYGKEAQERMGKFIDLRSPAVANEIKSWGQLAPMVFLPHNLKGAALALVKPFARYVQGKLLTRDATREAYRLTMKHASEGAFDLLKKDFAELEKQIVKGWGSVDDFMDDALDELEIYE